MLQSIDCPPLCSVCGRNVRYLRESKRLTQRQLASTCRMSTSEISRIERGKAGLTGAMIQRLSKALEVPYYRLFLTGDELDPDGERSLMLERTLLRIRDLVLDWSMI